MVGSSPVLDRFLVEAEPILVESAELSLPLCKEKKQSLANNRIEQTTQTNDDKIIYPFIKSTFSEEYKIRKSSYEFPKCVTVHFQL